MRRRYDPDVDLDGTMSSDSLDCFLLEKPEEVRLQFHRQVANLIQEERTTGGCLDLTDPALMCAREGPFFVSEKLGGDERRGYACAVYRHEGAVVVPGTPVDGQGCQLFSRAAFTPDQDRSIGNREPPDRLDNLKHSRTGSDHAVFAGIANVPGASQGVRSCGNDSCQALSQRLVCRDFLEEYLCEMLSAKAHNLL